MRVIQCAARRRCRVSCKVANYLRMDESWSLGRLRMMFLSWVEALKLDFVDDSRDIGLFCREITLLDGNFDNGVHFARKSAFAPI
jgi:hypothetical protein